MAGLNFLLPALLSTTQGLCPFIVIFAIFASVEVGSVSGRFGSGAPALFFSHSSYEASGGRLGGAKAAMPCRPSILGDKCFRLYFAWLFFPPTACAGNLGDRRAGLRGGVAAPPRCPGSESKLRLFSFFNLSGFYGWCLCVFFSFNFVFNLV